MPHDKPAKPPLLVWILLHPPQIWTTGHGNRTGSFQWLACKLMGYWFLVNAADTPLDSLFSATDECWSCFPLAMWKRSHIIFPTLSFLHNLTNMYKGTPYNNVLAVRNPCCNMSAVSYKNPELHYLKKKKISCISLKHQPTSIPLSARLFHL